MYHPEYSTVDPDNGNVGYKGPLELNRGNHDHMPPRTEAYLPGDERGHVNASSLGGVNTRANVVPQNHDVNRYSFAHMENGERAALKNGAFIESEKVAIVNGAPGDRPQNFQITDTVTYPDGHTEQIHHSFVNEAYTDQQAWNELSAALPGTFEAPNPGDELRDAMSPEAYADLMEQTDAELPGITADYAPADFSGAPVEPEASVEIDASFEGEVAAETAVSVDADVDADSELY